MTAVLIRASLGLALLFGPTWPALAGLQHGDPADAAHLPQVLQQAIAAQHNHDFPRSRELLHDFLAREPGHPQALLVLSAVEAATGHWDASRRACAPLATQMPAWLVAACLGQSADNKASIERSLSLIQGRPADVDTAAARWADDIAEELETRLRRAQWRPLAAHPPGQPISHGSQSWLWWLLGGSGLAAALLFRQRPGV